MQQPHGTMESVTGTAAGSGSADGAQSAKIARCLLRAAYRNNNANIGVNAVAGLAIAAMIGPVSGELGAVLLWSAALAVVSLLRFAISRHLIARSGDFLGLSDREVWLRRLIYAGGLVIGVVLWTIMTWMAFESGDARVRYSVLIVISALAAGATGILAAQLLIGRLYIALMLIQASAQLAISGNGDLVLAVLALVFLLVMLIGHRNNHAVLLQSYRLSFQNDDLVSSLKAKQASLTELNATLERRVQLRTADLKHTAEHDALTQLFNRTGIIEWVDSESRHGRTCATIFVDLDRFKRINDGLGHAVGDCVLAEVAARLKAAMPPGSALCRWGGDEFVAIAPVERENALAHGSALADRLRAAVNEKIVVNGRPVFVSLSAGLAACDLEAAAVSEAIRFADLAASEVKGRGRGATLVFSEDLAARQERQAMIVQALKLAVGNGELSVAFQPIVDAVTLETESHEVLLRWTNPILGRIAPDEFIPIAEETGQIVELGDFVIGAALRAFAAWPERRAASKVAINVSVRQLIAPGFVETLSLAARQSGIPPRRIVIEVTETVFADTLLDVTQGVLGQLRALGVEIHVDDFGTGYSSLSRLHEMPIQAIKIDKSFVQRMDPQAIAIIEGSVMIARKFGIATVAEGVETVEQAIQLRERGVTFLQGYLFGRPSPAPVEPLSPLARIEWAPLVRVA